MSLYSKIILKKRINVGENPMANSDADIDNDGKVDERELKLFNLKAKTQREMAWIALAAIVAMGVIVSFAIPIDRLVAIGDKLDWFWISLGSIVGAFVGVTTFMNKK